jgi:transposase
MSKHKSTDYKLTAVKYYLKGNSSLDNVCHIFNCSKKSLYRWVKRYKLIKTLQRQNRKPISYKITKQQLKYAIRLLNKNEQISMKELSTQVRRKYKTYNITSQHLGKVIRDNNITRKRTKHKHYPKIRHKNPTNLKEDLRSFYDEVRKYPINKIICLDETAIQPTMIKEYSRCYLGKRCIARSNDNYVFKSFTLICAISSSKCVGYKLYEKGGTTKERFVDFLQQNVFNKYKNYLIILDNAGSHNNDYVKHAIINSGNKYLFSVPYNPQVNAIENWFSQFKHHLKFNKRLLKYDELNKEIKSTITKIKSYHYAKYFNYAYKKEAFKHIIRKQSTLKRKLKDYKD